MYGYYASIHKYLKKASRLLIACTYNEKELLLCVSRGDTMAFTSLFNQYKDKIYTLAFKITGSAFTAEEVVQDIFLKLWTKREELSHVEHFKAWFNTIIRNHLFSLIKSRAARQARETAFANKLSPFNQEADQKVLFKEAEQILEKALYALPPQQNKVYRLIKEDGMKKEEVASRLNLSTETVKSHLSKAIKNIRAYCLAHMDHPVIVLLSFYCWN